MTRRHAAFFLLLLLAGTASAASAPPKLGELSGARQLCPTLEQMPAICNFHGGLAAGRNVLSIESLTLPPLSQGGGTARLTLDGQDIPAQWSQWLAHEIRRGASTDGLRVETAVRMAFEDGGVLFRAMVTNETDGTRRVELGVDTGLFLRRFDRTWEWGPPRPGTDKKTAVEATPDGMLAVADGESPAVAVFAFAAKPDSLEDGTSARAAWNLSLNAGETRTVEFVLAVGGDGEAIRAKAAGWAGDFTVVFDAAHDRWQERFDAAFTPNNGHFSGHLPLLETGDKALRRVYYGSVLSWLCLERTNFAAGFPRIFATASPHYAPTLTYFWDTISYATLWALLDPEQVRAQLRLFLQTDIHGCYAVDFLTLKGVGPWYSANDYTVFNLLWTYLRVTGDWAFLDGDIGGKSVLSLMEELALHWKTLVKNPGGLADYGTKDNLLETVPTYTNQVASFNAANVWMMRTLARIHETRGGAARAEALRNEADGLAREVLRLGDDATGWWRCRMPDGREVETRSIVDFLTVAACMTGDLSPGLRERMMDAADRELWAGCWPRALSLEDPSALATLASPEIMATLQSPWPGNSLRADHGFTGSYGAWPALAAEGCALLGRPGRARELLRAAESVLDEGPFGQSHYVSSPTRPVRKAFIGGQDYFEGCGAAFAEVILRCLCGYNPGLPGEPALRQPSLPGGETDTLVNLRGVN